MNARDEPCSSPQSFPDIEQRAGPRGRPVSATGATRRLARGTTMRQNRRRRQEKRLRGLSIHQRLLKNGRMKCHLTPLLDARLGTVEAPDADVAITPFRHVSNVEAESDQELDGNLAEAAPRARLGAIRQHLAGRHQALDVHRRVVIIAMGKEREARGSSLVWDEKIRLAEDPPVEGTGRDRVILGVGVRALWQRPRDATTVRSGRGPSPHPSGRRSRSDCHRPARLPSHAPRRCTRRRSRGR